MSEKQKYTIVTNGPVAKFYYQGSHTHPVRRTIIVIEDKKNILVGYEIREGNEVRKVKNAPVKSYRKDRIPNFGDYCRFKMSKKNYSRLDSETTLERMDFDDLVLAGV